MPDTGFVEIEGYKLHYRIEGSGPTALVIGSSVYYPRSFSKELRQHLRLIFVDWRGFAQTINHTDISLDTLLDDIEQIRQKLGLKTCMVIGHSAHALLALEYVKKYRHHVSHVIMIAISPNLSPAYTAAAEQYWQESVWPERKATLEKKIQRLPDEELSTFSPAERFVKWYVRRDPQAWYDFNFDSAWLWEGALPNMPMFDFLYGVALSRLDITRGLETFDTPVFLALGRYDFIVAPPSSWDPIRPKFQNLTVRVFEHSGHSPQYEEPAIFNEELIRWLKTHS